MIPQPARRRPGIIVGTVVLVVIILLIPEPEPPVSGLPGTTPFAWNQDDVWEALEARFRTARAAGCQALSDTFSRDRAGLEAIALKLETDPTPVNDPILQHAGALLFDAAALAAACSAHAAPFVAVATRLRSAVKRQSRFWDLSDLVVRRQLYRLLYGGRAAIEEVILQSPPGLIPALMTPDTIASATPSARLGGVTIHSGDILVSRGGAPTSALIARGSDYPGNFSHIALAYVDPSTGGLSFIESHIERGVAVATAEEYLADTKLRIMVLRLRPDHPALVADPFLPHRAAEHARADALSRHIPYDFAMDVQNAERLFCSEVASAAYRTVGVRLWMGMSGISSPGLASWLAAFGVRHFVTQEPADLEYDPQLSVAAEWRDPGALLKDHVDNAVLDAMLEGAERGDRLTFAWFMLPVARTVKGYSMVLNLFGLPGPVPEGMSAAAALKHARFSARHAAMREEALEGVVRFREREGYMPPYWEIVALARAAARAHPPA